MVIYILSILSIAFGSNDNELGVIEGENYTHKPYYFDIDKDYNFYIPDYYKDRIAEYDVIN